MIKQSKSAPRTPNAHISAEDLKKIRGGIALPAPPRRTAAEKEDEDFPTPL